MSMQHLPNGFHEETLKAPALCLMPVTWTSSAPAALPKITKSQSTDHRRMQSKLIQEISLAIQGINFLLFPPLTLVQSRDALSGSKVLRRGNVLPL